MSSAPPDGRVSARSAVSVVIATFNGERNIRATVCSALEQSEPPAEVVVVDDASTDATADRVLELQARSPLVRLIRLRRNSGGPARPYNVGIARASSPLVALLDHDDLWHRDKLHHCREALNRFPDHGLAYSQCQSFDGASPVDLAANGLPVEPTSLEPAAAVRQAFRGQFTLTMSNMVVRKSVWRQLGGFPERFQISTDYAFLARLLAAGLGVVHVPAALVYYRVSPGSVWLTSNYVRRNLERYTTVDFLLRRFPSLSEASVRQNLGAELFDLAFRAREDGRFWQALSIYTWSLRHYRPHSRVFRSMASVLFRAIHYCCVANGNLRRPN